AQPVAVRLQVEQDAGGSVGVAADGLEFHADGSVRERRRILHDGDREVRELLRVVHEIFVGCAVELPCVVEQQAFWRGEGRLERLVVDLYHLVRAVLRNHPRAHLRLERLRRSTDRLLAEIDGGGLRTDYHEQRGCGD